MNERSDFENIIIAIMVVVTFILFIIFAFAWPIYQYKVCKRAGLPRVYCIQHAL